MPLPAELIRAIQDEVGGKVGLVVGAGCSVPPPTSLRSGRYYSQAVHTLLVEANVLSTGQCSDPDDLSSLADAVYNETGHQAELVERLPIHAFRSAEPNEGHLIAAALLREKVIANIVTLNFDLAISNAVSAIGGRDVTVLLNPQEHNRLSATNVIYLHRSAMAEPDEWVLRTDVMKEEWKDGWEEIIAQRVLSGPITVFAGLGSPAAVLCETTAHIRSILPKVTMYQVDPIPREESRFFAELGLADDAYIQLGWVEFMELLSTLVANRQLRELSEACSERAGDEGWGADIEVLAGLIESWTAGLLATGGLRARWLLNHSRYVPRNDVEVPLLADLFLAAAYIARELEARPTITNDGVLLLERTSGERCAIGLASGKGIMRWATMDARVAQYVSHSPYYDRPSVVVVSGVSGGSHDLTPPKEIAGAEGETSIIGGACRVRIVSIDDLRSDPTLTERLLDPE